jgi:hypothetical protein
MLTRIEMHGFEPEMTNDSEYDIEDWNNMVRLRISKKLYRHTKCEYS